MAVLEFCNAFPELRDGTFLEDILFKSKRENTWLYTLIDHNDLLFKVVVNGKNIEVSAIEYRFVNKER